LQPDKRITAIIMAIDKVKYWLDIADNDLTVAEDLYKMGHWLYVAFMCHQVIEKMLKAYWTATCDDDPPYTHSHFRLLEACGLSEEISDEQATFLEFMIPMNIEARYPKYKSSVANTLSKDKAFYILDNTKQIRQWILQRLSPETRPSSSSETTNE